MPGMPNNIVPVVSVVMPVFNAAVFLKEAIESILSQSLHALELIVVDDASTDGSKEMALRYAGKDERVRLISHPVNKGNYPSRNEGMEMARGEFIAVMDSDDVAVPSRLEKQIEFLRSHPDYVLIGSQVLLTDPEGAPLGRKPGLHVEHSELDAALMGGDWVIIHPSVVMRRSSVEAIGGYRERFRTCADQDLYVRLGEIGRLANSPEVLLHYRQHYRSLTRLQSDQQHNLYIIQREARERRGLPQLKNVEIPPIKDPSGLDRRQKMRLRYKWAEIAMGDGYVRSAAKNLGYAFALDPFGTLRIAAGRAYRACSAFRSSDRAFT